MKVSGKYLLSSLLLTCALWGLAGHESFAGTPEEVAAAGDASHHLPTSLTQVPQPAAACPLNGAASTPSAPLLTAIPDCDLERVRKPVGGDEATSCGNTSESTYRQMTFLTQQAFRNMNRRSVQVAGLMTCLLGQTFSPAQITDALANMSRIMCSGSANPRFRVGCGNSVDSSAEFDPSPPDGGDSGGFCGALLINPDQLNPSLGVVRKVSMVDSIIHESTHALVRYLVRRYPPASTEPPSHSCNLPPLPSYVNGACDPTTRTRRASSEGPMHIPYQNDKNMYQPRGDCAPQITENYDATDVYPTRQPGDRNVTALRRPACPNNAARCFRATRTLTRTRTADVSDIYQNYEPPRCRAEGKFRNEIAARAVARLLAGGEFCQTTYNDFFSGAGAWRDH